MKKINKKNIIKGIIGTLILTISINTYSNFKKTGRYNYSYNNSIINEYNFDDLNNYILQGGASDGTYKYITAYDGLKSDNSVVIVMDNDNNIVNKAYIPSKSHVGGIAYDYDHNLMWITDILGTVSAFKKEELINQESPTPVYSNIDISENELLADNGNPSVACIAYANGQLFAANFSIFDNGLLKSVAVREDGSLDTNNKKLSKFVNCAQGLSFICKNDSIYLIVNTSYGPAGDSILKFYKYDEEINDYTNIMYKFFRMPPMGEGIFFDNNNNINIVNESNAKRYNTRADFFYKDASDITTLHTDTLTRVYKHW